MLKVIEAPVQAPERKPEAISTIEEVWELEEAAPVQVFEKTMRLEPEAPPETPPEAPKEDFIAASDMLDLMEKISEEMKQQELKETPPPPEPVLQKPDIQTPVPAVASPPLIRQRKNFLKPVLISGALTLLLGFSYWGIQSGRFQGWKNVIASKFHKEKPVPQASLPAKEPPAMPETISVPAVPQKVVHFQTPKKEIPRRVPRIEKRTLPAPPPQEKIPVKTPEEQKELENQKFFLPGVPSPKLSTSKVDMEAPLPEPKNEKPLPVNIPQEEVKRNAPSASPEKSDWKNQADWGN